MSPPTFPIFNPVRSPIGTPEEDRSSPRGVGVSTGILTESSNFLITEAGDYLVQE